VLDVRQGGPGRRAPLVFGGVHDRHGHTVRWSPASQDLLLSADGGTMLLHDLRAPERPLLTMRGHARPRDRKDNRFYTPTFSCGGRTISAVGAESQKLTVFSTDDGKILSQGELGDVATQGGTLLAFPTPQASVTEVLLFTSGKTLRTLVPL
jgi:hypothetical protein